MSIKFERLTTPELAIYQNKLIAYINDCDKVGEKLDKIMSMKGENNLMNRNRIDFLKKKVKESQTAYNQIQIELERRMKKKINVFLDYKELTEIHHSVDKAYSNFFTKKPKD